jgi:hypothetical protein
LPIAKPVRLGELDPIVHPIVWTEIELDVSAEMGPLADVTVGAGMVVVVVVGGGGGGFVTGLIETRTPFAQYIFTWSPQFRRCG